MQNHRINSDTCMQSESGIDSRKKRLDQQQQLRNIRNWNTLPTHSYTRYIWYECLSVSVCVQSVINGVVVVDGVDGYFLHHFINKSILSDPFPGILARSQLFPSFTTSHGNCGLCKACGHQNRQAGQTKANTSKKERQRRRKRNSSKRNIEKMLCD